MRVVLRNKEEIIVNTQEGEAVKKAITKSGRGMLVIAGQPIDKSFIVAVLDGGEPKIFETFETVTSPIKTASDDRRIMSEKICIGTKSIQKEIRAIARAEGDNWMKLLANENWREKVRADLRRYDQEWCDHREGTCMCS